MKPKCKCCGKEIEGVFIYEPQNAIPQDFYCDMCRAMGIGGE